MHGTHGTHAALRLTALAVLTLGSCGPSGPARYEISGKITYAGKAIPAGTIRFEPQQGPITRETAPEIEFFDGHYRLPASSGIVGGPHIVYITGFDGKGTSESPRGAPLFRHTYTEKVDLPKETATRDFTVPQQKK